jgi:hypothetical protein
MAPSTDTTRKSTVIIKAAGSTTVMNSARSSIAPNKGSSRRTGRDRTKSTAYGGLQVHVNGKNMTPLSLLKRAPFDLTVNDNLPFVPESEPGSPALPMPSTLQVKSGSKVTLSPPTSPIPPDQSPGGRPMSLRRQSSKNMLKPVAQEVKRSLSFTRMNSKADIQLEKQQQHQHHHHGHGHKNDESLNLPPGMTRGDLEKPVHFCLTESSTITLFHIASSCVASDDPKLNSIKTKNAQYAELCANKTGEFDFFSFIFSFFVYLSLSLLRFFWLFKHSHYTNNNICF